MRIEKILIIIGILFCLSLSALQAAEETPAMEMLVFQTNDAPAKIQKITTSDTPFIYNLALYAYTDRDIRSVTLTGRIFSADGSLKGTFIKIVEAPIKAQTELAVTLDLNTLLKPEKKDSPDMRKEFLNKTNEILIFPTEVYFTPPVDEDPKYRDTYWLFDPKYFPDLSPATAENYKKEFGRMKILKKKEIAEGSCHTCLLCNDAMLICGDTRGKEQRCVPETCVFSTTCSCKEAFCAFICKPADECCK
ncbi:MAG: hypothetical protein A2Y62_19915 [Candidatus Fischerbacteria bacterium RBG_13_37_8]|uniref:Uncharacterized protein n=1 Tax=Candidatus Fischerbacteria bacterium RBG_13_37_8 TaxID=1817863 RepID=A0A1F5VNU6_9BACT|nr:MAG: hypothetical protein A2Y62_19915 [Candidatus Fischerbacteria bacterium RBG_13_37_8]